MTPSTTPIRKPRTVSSRVTRICSHNGPCAVPFWNHFTSCEPMPDGWPKKKGSTQSSRVEISQPPMMNSASATRSTCTRICRRVLACARRRSRSAPSSGAGAASAVVVVIAADSGGETVLGTLITDEHLLSQVFPDFLVQLHEAAVETDLRNVAGSRQVDGVGAFDRPRSGGDDNHAIGQGDGFFQVVGDEHDARLERGPQAEQLVFHERPSLNIEGTEGLVHQQHPWFIDQRLGQRQALAHAA